MKTQNAAPFRAVRMLSLVLLCLPPAVLPATEPAAADLGLDNPFVSEGYAQLEAGNQAAALDVFEKALESNERDVSALLGRAMIFAEQQRHEEAFSTYDRIVEYYPKHAFAWNGRGLAAFNLENFDEALNSFQQATADHPVNGFFYESLAWTLMCRGEFERAAESAKTASLMYDRKGESSLYPLLIAYFSHLEAGETEQAGRALAYASQNKTPHRWPSPVVDYLGGGIDAEEMISLVTDSAQETEAHTYIGLHLRSRGQAEAAAKHLDWVSRAGDPRVFEYTLARAFNLRHSIALR